MTKLELKGGVIYDGLIIMAANKSEVDKILTFNTNDFKRLWVKDTIQIVSP